MRYQTLFALVATVTGSVVIADGLIKFGGEGKCLSTDWSKPYDSTTQECVLAGRDQAIWIEKGEAGSLSQVCLRLSTRDCKSDSMETVTLQKGNCYDIPHKEGAARWRAYDVIDGPCLFGSPGTLTSPCRIPIFGDGLANDSKCAA